MGHPRHRRKTDMDWNAISQNLRTESLVSSASGVDPLTVLSNPLFLVPAVLIMGTLVFLKMMRTLATIVGVVAIWIAVVYTLPDGGVELRLTDLGLFSVICIGVAAMWIYVYFVRN
jgi:1,4-dihydroxy-2-naphthoate octaprenyltransferase